MFQEPHGVGMPRVHPTEKAKTLFVRNCVCSVCPLFHVCEFVCYEVDVSSVNQSVYLHEHANWNWSYYACLGREVLLISACVALYCRLVIPWYHKLECACLACGYVAMPYTCNGICIWSLLINYLAGFVPTSLRPTTNLIPLQKCFPRSNVPNMNHHN